MTARPPRYTRVAAGLHWVIALLVIGLFAVGLYMTGLKFSPEKLKLYSYHKWTGVTVFVLVLARLAWLAMNPPPPLAANTPRWMVLASRAMHTLLYVLLVLIPISGWLMSSAKGVPTVWFGVLPLPDLLSRNDELGKTLATVHATLNYVFMTLIAVHVLAALKHQFIDKDGLIGRMWPFGART